MRAHTRIIATLVAFVALLVATLAVAEPSALLGFTRRPAQGVGTVVVPDHFLRSWDPVTVFFTRDMGPAEGGAEDRPGRFVRATPDHPGAWTWVDGRTLQFRPAEPWPPLTDFTWESGTSSVDLVTLMEPPTSTLPRGGSTGLDPVSSITLTFSQPLPTAALARMTRIELRPLPGIGDTGTRWLTSADYTLKAMERADATGPATYVLDLDEPVPLGTRAVVHFRLATDDAVDTSFARITFSTAEPFRPARLGCGPTAYPVTPEGVRYTADQVLSCQRRELVVSFTSRPSAIDPVVARNLIRLEPSVEGLEASLRGRDLVLSGPFDVEQLYKVTLAPTDVTDVHGRPLEIAAPSEVWVTFPRKSAYLQLTHSRGILERLGPQVAPLEARGHDRVDLRIHALDPLDRSFWPFPDSPVTVDEAARPPSPGEEPAAFTDPQRHISSGALVQQLRSLGSPEVSTLVDLPVPSDGGAGRFGLDLSKYLAFIAGERSPGHYLVGVRALDGSSSRTWMRVQVTDLSLTAIEEVHATRFVVTSLSSGGPVGSAAVRIEGSVSGTDGAVWETLWEGRTDASGSVEWSAPGRVASRPVIRRITVTKGDDVLVLDPTRPPDTFADNHWHASRESWLQWAYSDTRDRAPSAQTLAHVFTERPVYRPGEPVHLKGWLRTRHQGRLEVAQIPGAQFVVVAPGGLEWRLPAEVTAAGGVYARFEEGDDVPTGEWYATLRDERDRTYGQVSFQVEAYRLPRFEVQLASADPVPLDGPFEVALDATYYAGGAVAGQPVRWRVTPYPAAWSPETHEGFVYSSDSRYSRPRRLDTSPRSERGRTDGDGHAVLTLDPSVESSAAPRTYVVEATVTGADDQTVTATTRVQALPPFVLGLKAPRFLEQAESIPVELLVSGPDGGLLAGQEVTVRLKHRQWHSHLQASDFTDGVARYVTDVVDDVVSERTVTSVSEPLALRLPVDEAGVYLVELESRDRLGRAQVVEVDLYAGGDEAVSWDKPQVGVFSVATDARSYAPGDTAHLVLQSPFQSGQALVIVEAPDGNRYEWVKVRGGVATVRLPVEEGWVPRVPVHTVLMRGRISESAPDARSQDLGKPTTVAATTWLQIDPVENQVQVTLTHPERAAPGETIPVTVELRTPDGEPVAGEVTLYLVDAAVLAMGREQRLDPLPDYITPVSSHLALKDTRSLVLGRIPWEEMPGGGGEDELEDALSPLDRQTVREDFRPVAYYEPSLRVGADGRATVQVHLPDNLTVFKVRAKAAAGPDRFGAGKSQLRVRLPVIVQPTFPRFVRAGDRFTATAIGRVVEGDGGDAVASLRGEGVTAASTRQELSLDPTTPTRVDFALTVPTPSYTEDGVLERDEVVLTVVLERSADGVGDAFEARLPLLPDRDPERERLLADLEPGASVELPHVRGTARPGTVRRSVLVTDAPALTRMAAAMDFFHAYPYGCTEQRVSKARALLALGSLRESLHAGDGAGDLARQVDETLAWLPGAVDSRGLVAYWPGSDGSVFLTAWTVEFLVEARDAGFSVDEALMSRLTRSLRAALRSDYRYFADGEAYAERTAALRALAAAGEADAAYLAELSRRAQWQRPGAVARVVLAGVHGGQADSPAVRQLAEELSGEVVLRLHQGNEIYSGFQRETVASRRILPSEARTVAEVSRALARVRPDDPNQQILVDALVTLGGEDGWGTTNANAAALLALRDHLETRTGPSRTATLSTGQTLTTADSVAHLLQTDAPATTLAWGEDVEGFVWSELSWVPAADGSQVGPQAQGFALTRAWELVQAEGVPPRRVELDAAGQELAVSVGQVVEEHLQLVTPETRHFVAVVAPLAAGMEPLNPALATAPPEATPSRSLTLRPTYTVVADDHVAWYYDELPKGTYDFAFRARASFTGSYVQPAARAELMYDGAVRGGSAGAQVVVSP